MKKYLVTYAQNATPIHKAFFAAMQTFCKVEKATLLIVPGRYRNPTSKWSQDQETDEWWAPEVTGHLVSRRLTLCPNLRVFGEIKIQPTASRPLSGFEVFVGENSAIFGHPKRALTVVPTGTRTPRVMWTTGACTLPNYTDSKAGKKGRAHHVIGALVVEVQDDGLYFARHVTWDSGTQSFTDLNSRYTVEGRQEAPRAAALVMGDYHAGQEDEAVIEATEELVHALQPRALVGHDWLDFNARTHHDKGHRNRYDKRFDSVEAEVEHACDSLVRFASWPCEKLYIVRSNHDEMFERWLNECDPTSDPANAPYYHDMWFRCYRFRKKHGRWPNCFEVEARRHGVPKKVVFLKRNQSLRIKGIECGFHGDKGNGGAKGTPLGYAKLGVKTVTGHTHTPAIIDGAFVVGVTAGLDHGYNLLPSTWLNAHVIVHADGKRQLVILVDGKYRGE